MAEPLDLPMVSVRRGGITYPAEDGQVSSVEIRGLRGSAAVPFPDTVIVAPGWCAPAEYLDELSPDGRARIEYETRPCGGEHRWERWVDRPQCGCPQCDTTERYLECAGCPAVVREGQPGFDELWKEATWP